MMLEPFLNAIYTSVDNQTTWEARDDVYGIEQKAVQGLTEAMGDDFIFLWLIPVTPNLNIKFMQQVYKFADQKRKKPEEYKYYPMKQITRSTFEVAIWAFTISVLVCFRR